MNLTATGTALKQQLIEQHASTIVDTQQFTFPLHTVNVSYHPIIKTPMDILMKMMLLSFQRAPIKDTDVLASILLVESLFIEDLTKKMQQAQIISKDEEGVYRLTEKGEQQLAAGVYEEQLELVTEEIQYSAIHEGILEGNLDAILEIDELPEPLSYVDEQLEQLNENRVIDQLQESAMQNVPGTDEQTEELITYITALTAHEAVQIHDIPLLLFILKDKRDDRLFGRVYNTFTGEWDSTLETFIHEHERVNWVNEYK